MEYAPPTAGPAPSTTAAPTGKGHGAFTEEDIQQIMAETGFDYQQVCSDIDQSGAQTKQELYPQFYAGEGIQPQGQMVGNGVVQPRAPTAPPVGAPEEMVPPEGAAPPPQSADALPPEALQAMHQAMAPPPTPLGRPEQRPQPRWKKNMRDEEMEA